jgi:hypothetical protein
MPMDRGKTRTVRLILPALLAFFSWVGVCRRSCRWRRGAALIIGLLASTAAPTNNSKLEVFGKATLHSPTSQHHRDGPVGAGANFLPHLERR